MYNIIISGGECILSPSRLHSRIHSLIRRCRLFGQILKIHIIPINQDFTYV